MRSTIITAAIILSAGFTACTSTENSDIPVKTASKENSKQKDAPIAFNFSEAQPIDSTDYVLYPLATTATREDQDEYGYKSSAQCYRNVIFYNVITKKYHLLDNRKMLITSYSVENDESSESKPRKALYPRLIYYKVVVNDYNGDGILNESDPEYLFISDRAGSYFKQVSPDNLNVTDWKELPEKGKVLIQARADINGDTKFDDKGAGLPYIYDIKLGTIAAPVFSKGFTDSVGTLLKTQWAKKEK